MSRTITVRPETFTLVPYDASVIAGLLEEVADRVGLPPDLDLTLDVDEELFAPLTGHTSDVVDGQVQLWISGADFEDPRAPRSFAPDLARADLAVVLLRADDRLRGGCADAPPDAELSRGERAAWDTWAWGRAERLGFPTRRQARLYEFRLQHGFTDVADAAFERLWSSDTCTWDDLRAVCAETGAAQRGPSKVPVDVLRQR